MNNNIDDQGAPCPLNSIFANKFMRNRSEIKGFCSKSCYLRPSSNLFINVMQQSEPDLTYGTVPGAQLSDVRTFFSLLLFLARFYKNFQSSRGPTQSKSGPFNSMVSKRNYLLYHFSITIHLHLASFYVTIYF